MGQFSWMDCKDPKKNITIWGNKPCYVLLPEHINMGQHIKCNHYDGYGNFGGYDIYELVAEFNRDVLHESMLEEHKPVLENFGDYYDFEKDHMRENGMTEEEIEAACLEKRKEYFNRALKRYEEDLAVLNDYKAGVTADIMDEKYGLEWKRELGINIAAYDEQNISLPFPIKITYDEFAIYKLCPPSLSDPDQGR